MTELNGSSQHFYSNKPSLQIPPSTDDISQLRHGNGTPSSMTNNKLEQYSPSPGMKQNSFDYQLTQEKRVAKAAKIKPAGKIILKKINHFTDN
jgi:DUF971 family protein